MVKQHILMNIVYIQHMLVNNNFPGEPNIASCPPKCRRVTDTKLLYSKTAFLIHRYLNEYFFKITSMHHFASKTEKYY